MLALEERAHQLYEEGLTSEEIRGKLASAPSHEIVEWYTDKGVSALMAQVNHSRSRTPVTTDHEQRVEYDEDGVQIPLVELPPLTNADGPTKPSAQTKATRQGRVLYWAMTTKTHGRSWLEAADDIDFLYLTIERDRATGAGLYRRADITQNLISDLIEGTPKEEALANVYEAFTKESSND